MTDQTKVALVTGGSSGIGLATAKLLTKKGYRVALVGSRKEKVEQATKECLEVSSTFQPLGLVLDFSKPENGEVAVKKTIEHFGRLDALINNAGIFIRSCGNDPSTYDAYREVMAINTDATVKATLAAVEELKRVKGTLIFVSSVASIKSSEKGYAYCMSKAAMSSFAKCLAIDLAPHVRVNIVSPGPVLTPIFDRVGLSKQMVEVGMSVTTLQERIGQSEEIANTIAFLISDEASFVNGHEMFVDGGYLLKPSNYSASQRIFEAKVAQQQ